MCAIKTDIRSASNPRLYYVTCISMTVAHLALHTALWVTIFMKLYLHLRICGALGILLLTLCKLVSKWNKICLKPTYLICDMYFNDNCPPCTAHSTLGLPPTQSHLCSCEKPSHKKWKYLLHLPQGDQMSTTKD